MKRKIFSIVLSLCMVLTMMPMATGAAWAATGTTADSVTVGGVEMVNGSNTTYYKDGNVSTTAPEGGYNAKYEPGSSGEPGTLTLKGLLLSDSSNYCIYAKEALNIVLEGGEGNANSLVHSDEKNIIYVSGNLTISGPGSLTAGNGSSNLTTIYAKGDITINGGAVVNATHAGGGAQAINAEKDSEDASIVISGEGTTVTATYSGNDQTNGFALKADSINVSCGATLTATATSGKQAVSGSVCVDTANSDVYAGDSEPGTKLEPINSTDTYTAKYLRIAPKAPVATALEDITFDYAYDVQRSNPYPTKDETIHLSSLQGPIIDSNRTHGLTTGNWTLTKAGTYSYMKSSDKATINLDSIVEGVARNYDSLDPDTIVIHELKNGDEHISYGVVVAYNAAAGYALFQGDILGGSGAGYFLSTSEESGEFDVTASAIATDFVQNMSISLSQTELYTFPSATVGYGEPTPATVTITNTGNAATGALTVSLSGTGADSFTLSTNSISSIGTEENAKTAQFTITPKTDLAAATYTATVTVSGQNIVSKSFDVSFTVSEASQPSRPSRPNRDNVTVSGSASSSDAKTDADLSKTTVTADGVTTSTVDTVTAGKIVDKSVANKSTSIDIKATSGSDATKTSNVIIPTATIKSISEKTDASMNIKCDIANIEFSKESIDAMASQATGDTVQIIVEKVSESQHEVHFELKVVCSDGTVISDYNGGSISVTVSLPSSMADKDLVCVYIDDEGIYNKVDGMLNADGSYTFITNHFSTYAIMSEEEADAVIKDQTAAAQKAAIKNVKTTVTLSTKEVKKGIRVTVKVPEDQKADKTGIIIYRSTSKNAKPYAVYKKVATKGSTYIIRNYYNVKGNRLVKGKTYYYKARAYKVIDGKTYYGPMSTIKYMKAK